jgi:hypothetical protein
MGVEMIAPHTPTRKRKTVNRSDVTADAGTSSGSSRGEVLTASDHTLRALAG